VNALSEDWLVIVIAAVFAFVVGFLLSWALLQGRTGDDQREREAVAQPFAQVAEERAALRSLREKQVAPLREFLARCSERVAAFAERDYRLDLYERSPALQSAVARDAFYAEVTHAISDKQFWQEAMQSFFRASAVSPNPQIRELVRSVWEDCLSGEAPSSEAAQTLERANRSLEDYVVGA
jgi:hypothetical protein